MEKQSRPNDWCFEDRFIPRRTGQNFQHFNINSCLEVTPEIKPNERRFINHGMQFIRKKLYQETLLEVMAPKSSKVFSFSKCSSNSSITKNFEENWPIKPRKKPCITSLSYLLDIPDLQMNMCHNVIDWGANGCIAATSKGTAYTWQPGQASTIIQGGTEGKVNNCIKFNTTGSSLAIGLAECGLVVVNSSTNKYKYRYLGRGDKTLQVTSLEWLKNDTLIVGSSKGMLFRVNTKSSFNLGGRFHEGGIMSIKKSCCEHYLATSGLDCRLKVWTLPHFEIMFETELFLPIKAFAWHPWKEPLLVTPGGVDNSILTLWNVASARNEYTYHEFENTAIDALTFNPLSAELVVSCINKTTFKSYILVLASFTKQTELIEWHTGRVPYLIWSENLKQLLTAGTDENICIWEFFETQKKKPLVKHSARNKKKLLSSFCIR